MKNHLIILLLSLLIALTTGCVQPLGGDIDFGDVTVTNHYEYGDSIVTINGSIHYGDYTGPSWSNWQYIDQSNNVHQVYNITTMIDNSIRVENGGYYMPNGTYTSWTIGQIVYDHSTKTLYEFNGDYWEVKGDVNSGNWYYDQSTNTFTKVINKDESTTITNVDNSIYINGNQYNGNVVYDHRDQRTYSYWNSGVWFAGDGNTYSYDNSTYSWSLEYKVANLCPTPCQTDTLCPKDTVFQTITVLDTIITTVTDTIYSIDTVVIVMPTGSHYAKVTSRESQADRDNNRLLTGGYALRGSIDTARTFLPITMGVYAKIVETSYDASNGSGTYYAASPISGDSVAFSVAPRNGFSLNSVLANAGGGNVLLGKALTFNFTQTSANLDLPNPSLGEWGTFLDSNHDFRVMYCVQTPELMANYPSATAGFVLLEPGTVYENYGVGQTDPNRFVTVQ